MKVGTVVKFADGWCTEGEKHYIFVVLEYYDNMDRVRIKCLNCSDPFGYYETVGVEMVEVLPNPEGENENEN